MKPAELANAEIIDALCERYGTLPWPGSLLEQPAIQFLRLQALISLARGEEAERSEPVMELADLQMVMG